MRRAGPGPGQEPTGQSDLEGSWHLLSLAPGRTGGRPLTRGGSEARARCSVASHVREREERSVMLSVGMRVCVRVWKRTREPLCVRKRRRERAAQPARDAAWGRDQSCVRDPAGKCASRGCGQASAYVCLCVAEWSVRV